MSKLKTFFKQRDFSITNGTTDDFYDFYAKKKGVNMVIMRYTDFYFVKEAENLSLDYLKDFHSKGKALANTHFKLPKALRLNVPNINSVLIVSEPIKSEVLEYISSHKVSLMGGEQESLFVLDIKNKSVYCAGRDKTYISGEAKLIWGSSKEFKEINGRNRAFYLVKHLVEQSL